MTFPLFIHPTAHARFRLASPLRIRCDVPGCQWLASVAFPLAASVCADHAYCFPFWFADRGNPRRFAPTYIDLRDPTRDVDLATDAVPQSAPSGVGEEGNDE